MSIISLPHLADARMFGRRSHCLCFRRRRSHWTCTPAFRLLGVLTCPESPAEAQQLGCCCASVIVWASGAVYHFSKVRVSRGPAVDPWTPERARTDGDFLHRDQLHTQGRGARTWLTCGCAALGPTCSPLFTCYAAQHSLENRQMTPDKCKLESTGVDLGCWLCDLSLHMRSCRPGQE